MLFTIPSVREMSLVLLLFSYMYNIVYVFILYALYTCVYDKVYMDNRGHTDVIISQSDATVSISASSLLASILVFCRRRECLDLPLCLLSRGIVSHESWNTDVQTIEMAFQQL